MGIFTTLGRDRTRGTVLERDHGMRVTEMVHGPERQVSRGENHGTRAGIPRAEGGVRDQKDPCEVERHV